MNKIYSQYNLERLRLQQSEKDSLKLERSDVKRGTGKNAIRKIFGIDEGSKHEYDIYEQQQLDAFKKEIEEERDLLTDEIILRFLYANHFDFPQTIKHMRNHQQWLQDPNNFKWSLNTEEMIKQGAIYVSGRGQGYKPIIVINADKFDITIYPIDDIMRAISIVLMVVKDYMLVPGKVESWYIIVEAKNTTAFSVPFTHLNQIFDMLKLNFPCYLERMFILQPQTSIQITWQIVEQFIPYNSRHKIEFVTNDFSLMFNYIKPKQLEQRHGGRAPNIYDYWPPHVEDFNEVEYLMKEQEETKKIQEQINQLQKVMPFTSSIDLQVSNLLRKHYKPKNKIYQEETHLETTNYYLNKSNSKTVFLNAPKVQQIISTQQRIQEQQEMQSQQKPQEVNASFEQQLNNNNYLNYPSQTQFNPNTQSNQLNFRQPQFQSRFIGSKTRLNETQNSQMLGSQNPNFQSRFVGPKTQHLFIKQDVSIIANKEELVSAQHSQIM
ncbi:unnamed protein product [Paramecium pentaurelia]|uniref:CRAL-TRIO domain-containing protein n=1 Tax=Paramecium pentaurelia TaxID=43138 RepID=A0A8S1WFF1_9CILI|nr:unnamed protein product [Paramecium pentaurelia]